MLMLLVGLAPGDLNHTANTIKGFAIAIGVAFAIWVAYQLSQARARDLAQERAQKAKAVYSRHLALALNYPELAEPMLGSQSSAAEAARYRIYVQALLAAADEILALEPSEAWRQTLTRLLVAHRSYLMSGEFEGGSMANCSAETQSLIRSVTAAGRL